MNTPPQFPLWRLGGKWWPLTVLFFFIILCLPFSGNWLFQLSLILSYALAVTLRRSMPGLSLEEWVQAHFGDEIKASVSFGAWLAGGLLMAAILTCFELRIPYYFTKDDNFVQFLPTILQAMRGAFDEGVFPTWNGFQHLGVPTASLGYYALTYPPTYLCYGLARYACGNEFLTLELFVWLHLFAAYSLSFMAMRRLGSRPSLAMAGAFCFVMMGFNVVFVGCWYHGASNLAWLSALGLSLALFMRGPMSRRWIIGTACAIGCYFHSGNVQLWCYGMLFWGLGIAWVLACNRRDSQMRVGPVCAGALAAILGGLAIAAPLLLAQAIETAPVQRSQLDVNIADHVNNILLPWGQKAPRIRPDVLMLNEGDYFSGGLFACCFFIRLALDAACLSGKWRNGRRRMTMCFSLIGLFALMLALGNRGLLYGLLSLVPPFSRFRVPMKFVPFMSFFIILSGGELLETVLRRLRRPQAGVAVAIGVMALTAYTLKDCMHNGFVWADNSYAALPPAEQAWRADGFSTRGRILSLSRWAPQSPGYSQTLEVNFPTLYRIPAATGFFFTNLEIGLPENVAANHFFTENPGEFNRQFGVERLLISTLPALALKLPIFDSYLFPSDSYPSLENIRKHGYPETKVGVLRVFDVRGKTTKPMAYIEADPAVPLPYRLLANGMVIQLDNASPGTQGHVLIANFLYRHWFEAGNEKGESLPVRKDALGRIAVDVPAGCRLVSIRYAPPWREGFILGCALMLMAGALARRTEYHKPADV